MDAAAGLAQLSAAHREKILSQDRVDQLLAAWMVVGVGGVNCVFILLSQESTRLRFCTVHPPQFGMAMQHGAVCLDIYAAGLFCTEVARHIRDGNLLEILRTIVSTLQLRSLH